VGVKGEEVYRRDSDARVVGTIALDLQREVDTAGDKAIGD